MGTTTSGGGAVQPFVAIAEAGATELIDKDDAEVAQNEFGKSVAVSLGGTYSGEILSWIVVQTELGSGAILSDLAGELWVFDADPGISAGDADITAAEAQTLIGVIRSAIAICTPRGSLGSCSSQTSRCHFMRWRPCMSRSGRVARRQSTVR